MLFRSMKAAVGSAAAESSAIDLGQGISLVARQVSGLDKDGLRAVVDQERARIKSGVVVLAAPQDGKVAQVHANAGDSLAVDQKILEFA